MNDLYNLYYKDVRLNSQPMTFEDAMYEIGLIIINYGYKPEIKKIVR
jgi:hypothetical protein